MSKRGRTLGPLWRLIRWQKTQNGKPFTPVSIDSRQQERAKDRRASFETVKQHYGPEPRQARRNISRVWARNLMHERQAAARRRVLAARAQVQAAEAQETKIEVTA
jgi:hypothetical protein